MGKRIPGIVGSYRKNGVIDTLVTNVLSAAEEQGAETEEGQSCQHCCHHSRHG